jgi:hypothetical protein
MQRDQVARLNIPQGFHRRPPFHPEIDHLSAASAAFPFCCSIKRL